MLLLCSKCSSLSKKILDIASSEANSATYPMAGYFAAFDHAVDCQRFDPQDLRKFFDGEKFLIR